MTRLALMCVALFLGGAGCAERSLESDVADSECLAYPNGVNCVGQVALMCTGGAITSYTDCNATLAVCIDDVGCAVCEPGAISCTNNTGMRCRADGTGFDMLAMCDESAGEFCNVADGQCETPCRAAQDTDSYLGCEYWAAVTPNSKLFEPDIFAYAVVVSNPNLRDVTVRIDRGSEHWERTIGPLGLETIELPWVSDLLSGGSGVFRGGAYHIESTLPIAAYQFNPLEFRQPRYCVPDSGSPCYYSYTNDASLLLPTHVLTGNYTVMSYPAQHAIVHRATDDIHQYSPSFFTLVGTAADTSVEVTFAANAVVNETSYASGDVATFMVGEGDVLQIRTPRSEDCPVDSPTDSVTIDGETTTTTYCNVTRDFDLTGSRIRASAPVELFAGNDCALVPKDKRRCDHLEEIMIPEDAWGKRLVVSVTQALRGEPNVIRIISSADNNMVTFEPELFHSAVVMNRGDILEFETTQDFVAVGQEEILVGQFLVAQWYNGPNSTDEDAPGDPSMSLAIPQEQFLSDYTFLAPPTFDLNYVNITTFGSADVLLDGVVVTGLSTPSATDGLRLGRIPITGGTHTLRSVQPFGIVVYGYAAHTSYMIPGGLNLSPINLF